ncbi:MAG: hypothetical protein HY673_27360 [Chloroflexi bacterium]|nr:hypothetical protein [Chloroflexota bacterium]
MNEKQITILNPQSEVEVTQQKLSPRAGDLRGKVAGLLVVPMSTSGDFIDRIEELLIEKYGVARVVKKWKVNSTKPSTPEFLNEITSQSDFAVVGVGT